MRDFTLSSYKYLLSNFLLQSFKVKRFDEFIKESPSGKILLLRHDVDLLPENSLATAKIENEFGITSTYFFRIIPETFRADIIKEISNLGHEIGYHYEDMDLVKANKLDKHVDLAYESFKKNLEMLRKLVPINTICMHGSPRAKYDNKLIWSKYNYNDLGIIGEPYFDIDFNEFFYLTDTGRKWNGNKVSIRDKVDSKYKIDLKSTIDVVNAIPKLPTKMMITIHPQRWSDSYILWLRELVMQNIKNVVKRALIIKNK